MDVLIKKLNVAKEITDEMIEYNAQMCLESNGGIDGIAKLQEMASGCKSKSEYLNFFTNTLGLNAEKFEKGIIVHLNKTQCSCPMAAQLNIDKSRLCDCTIALEKYMWSKVFDREIDVRIVESFWHGGKDCVLELII